VVEEGGGARLGDGCFIVPEENLDKTTTLLKQFDLQFDVMRVYASSLTKVQNKNNGLIWHLRIRD